MMAESHHLFHAFKWSIASDLASKAIQPLVFLVLARLLTPEDFGVMSAALMVIALSQIFWEAGMSKALIQRQADIEDAANAAFWINVGMGLLVAGAIYLVAGTVANTFFHDPRVVLVLRVMTIQVLLGAVSAVHTALLQKEMMFNRLFWVRFSTVGLPGLASIPLAWHGMGYWALVAGTLLGQVAQVITLWRITSWRPRWSFNTLVAREMTRFGGWVAVTGLMAWVYSWSDSLIVGKYFGTALMGIYRVGNQFSTLVFAILLGPALPVVYSKFSLIGANEEDKVEKLLFLGRLVGAITIPMSMAVFLFGGLLEKIIFGEKWAGVSFVISMIALKEGVLWPFAFNIEAYRSMAKPHYETWIACLSSVLNPVILVVCARQGFVAFVYGRAILLAVIGVLIHLSFVFLAFGKRGTRSYIPVLRIWLLCVILMVIDRAVHAAEKNNTHYYYLAKISLVAMGFLLSFRIARNEFSTIWKYVLQAYAKPTLTQSPSQIP
jgi:PST family polysaccharide transporter